VLALAANVSAAAGGRRWELSVLRQLSIVLQGSPPAPRRCTQGEGACSSSACGCGCYGDGVEARRAAGSTQQHPPGRSTGSSSPSLPAAACALARSRASRKASAMRGLEGARGGRLPEGLRGPPLSRRSSRRSRSRASLLSLSSHRSRSSRLHESAGAALEGPRRQRLRQQVWTCQSSAPHRSLLSLLSRSRSLERSRRCILHRLGEVLQGCRTCPWLQNRAAPAF
jgi:hypothetical protein